MHRTTKYNSLINAQRNKNMTIWKLCQNTQIKPTKDNKPKHQQIRPTKDKLIKSLRLTNFLGPNLTKLTPLSKMVINNKTMHTQSTGTLQSCKNPAYTVQG